LVRLLLRDYDIANRTGGISLLVRAAYATKDEMGMRSEGEATAWIKELGKLIFDGYWQYHNLSKEVLPIIKKIYKEN
jgi:hypothetical protein